MNHADLIGVAEAAEVAKVSRATIKRLAAGGALKVAMKMPGASGAYLFERSEIERFKQERVA